MNQDSLLERLQDCRIVPVIAIDSVEHAVPLADALTEGGLPLAEITFRTSAAAEVIKLLKKERPNLLVGAGTVLSADTLKLAIDCGAEFAVAPGTNRDVVAAAMARSYPFIPGVATPSEIEQAMELGCRILKFFPAEASGGVGMIKAFAGPYAHTGLKVMPTGGVTVSNLESYISQSLVAAVGGTWIATKEDMARGDWNKIVSKCKAACDVARACRG